MEKKFSKQNIAQLVVASIAFLCGGLIAYTVSFLMYQSQSNSALSSAVQEAGTESNHDVLRRFGNGTDHNLILASTAATHYFNEHGIPGLGTIYELIENDIYRAAIVQSIIAQIAEISNCHEIIETVPDSIDPTISEELIIGVCTIQAKFEPQKVLASVKKVGSPALKIKLQNSVAVTWANDSPLQLRRHLNKFEGVSRVVATRLSLLHIARDATQDALNSYHELRGSGLEVEVGREIALSLYRTSKDESLDWAEQTTFSDTAVREEILIAIYQQISQEDSELAMQWALQQPLEHSRQLGMEAVVISEIAKTNSLKAVEMLPRVRPGVTALRASIAVGNSLLHEDRVDEALKISNTLGENRMVYLDLMFQIWSLLDSNSLYDYLDKFSGETKSQASLYLLLAQDLTLVLSDKKAQLLSANLTTADQAKYSELTARRIGQRVMITQPNRAEVNLLGLEIDLRLIDKLLSQ